MKTIRKSVIALFGAAMLLSFNACQKDDNSSNAPSAPSTSESVLRNCARDVVYPANSHPFGKSLAAWGGEWWKWVYRFDCANSPMLDVTGAKQNQGQWGPVFFLGGGQFNSPVTRNVTVSDHQSLFFPMITEIYDYPNPNDPTYQPAPGQTLVDFLTQGVQGDLNQVDILSATLDGTSIANLTNYRGTSGLFNFRGNPDVANCIDNFINGQVQQGVSDGFWLMLKPLRHGQHTLHFTGGLSANTHHPLLLIDVTYNLNVH